MNNEEVMAKILNWVQNDFTWPNDQVEGSLIIIPKFIRNFFNFLD